MKKAAAQTARQKGALHDLWHRLRRLRPRSSGKKPLRPSCRRLCAAGVRPGGCTALALDTPLPAGHSGAHRLASAAADFAAKEAFLKAAGTGLREPFALREIEAVRLESGAPAYRFSGATARWVADHGLTAHLSLSHDGGMALAFCILETAPET